ncbi:uncharacterized protein N7496_001137 [Penicillium cataractarum]|uniref:Uncharacterized protein n=1 Tax=Penicillium cataractarum TaxID=2100454 RepID=A0A9W9VVS8_9EURO|nr:uncharacterized protein N7496_001137 [Penicillium cataractarum]KAJ5390069.1 hypothetical protein N7496_001137 [Penicillium cataractarum]
MGDKMEGPGNTYGTTTTGASNSGSAARDSNMGDAMKTNDNYGSTTAGLGSSGGNLDSSKMASGMNDTAGAGMDNLNSGAYTDSKMGQNVESGGYGATQQNPSTMDYGAPGMQNRAGDLSTDPGTYSSTGGYGSGNMNTASGLNDSRMANEMNTAADTSLGNRGTDTMASTVDRAGQSSGNAMESGANTMNTGSSNMANQMETRAKQEMENLSGQQGFGGAAAGGSSYNAPTPTTKRRSSGPHSSNWLNKLDPRVHSSDYEANAASNQRGN